MYMHFLHISQPRACLHYLALDLLVLHVASGQLLSRPSLTQYKGGAYKPILQTQC